MISAKGRRALVVAAVLGLAGCATATREPPNIYPLKQRIRAYIDGGDYQRDIAAVAAQATQWIETRARKGGDKLTVVLDLDETLFSSWPLISRLDFGYQSAEWDKWVEEARAPAIEPVREVFRAARRAGVDVIFITGRLERHRSGTERNLRAIDCTDYVALICQLNGVKSTSVAFKTAERAKLAAAGRTIIANLGDQQSDLDGGFAERTFKLPNPLYLSE